MGFSFRPIQLALVLLGGLVAAQAHAGSMRCNGRLIEPGDAKARLVAQCGAPMSKSIVAVERASAGATPTRLEYVEEWTYAAPSTSGFQILRFEAGRLTGDGMRCGNVVIREGDLTRTVLDECGEPISRDTAGLAPAAPAPVPSGEPPVLDVPIEQWVYDRGRGQFIAIVTVRGGRVEAIEDGRRR